MKRDPWSLPLVALAIATAMTPHAFAAPPGNVRCVQPTGSDANAGTDWGTGDAWETLEFAISEMNSSGGAITEIWLLAGTYVPPGSTTADSWAIHAPVVIRGGFAGTESSEAARPSGTSSRLSGNLGLSTYSDRLMLIELPFKEPGIVTLDRLRFEDGGTPLNPTTNVRGAAVNAPQSGLTALYLRGCQFARNSASTAGGAIYVEECLLDARMCTFEKNISWGRPSVPGLAAGGPSEGGAIHSVGGSVLLSQCTFEDNHAFNVNDAGADAAGGAIYLFPKSVDSYIINCSFLGNSASTASDSVGLGGAVYQEAPVSFLQTYWTNCLFANNFAGEDGGGGYTLAATEISSCTFSQNHAADYGGGLAFAALGTSESVIQNSILWDNAADDGADKFEEQMYMMSGSTYTLQYSCVEGVAVSSGNIDSDPMFVNTATNNFRLLACSPAVNNGLDTLLPLDIADLNQVSGTSDDHPFDLDGTLAAPSSRVKGGALDMGAYELESNCAGDLNDDGVVNGADLGALLAVWGPCAGCPADLNCDEVVNGADLGTLLAVWGPCDSGDESMVMASGANGGTPADLLGYLGATTIEEAVDQLVEMIFEEMEDLLTGILGGIGPCQ